MNNAADNTLNKGRLRQKPEPSVRMKNRMGLSALTMLFFLWGFITSLNDILIPYLKGLFALSYFQVMAVNFCFFGAYAIVSYPAGKLVKNIGYQKGIVFGLMIAAFGGLLFLPAANYKIYGLFLLALFVLASGITLLQVSANPYVTQLGSSERASSRLTLTQAFNSLGTTIAPIFGALLILSIPIIDASQSMSLSSEQISIHHQAQADAVKFPYFLISLSLLSLAALFYFLKLPLINTNHQVDTNQQNQSAWKQTHLILGAVGIFVYVGAEVSIGSFLVNFLGESHIAQLSESSAAHYVAYYWGGAMIGRFIGAALMLRFSASKILAVNAAIATILVVFAIVFDGKIAMWSILSVGLFNSIMFPTIFSLALTRLGPMTSQASGILCFAIVGGALIPLVQGALADAYSIQIAFIIPAFCYLYIVYYGLNGYRPIENIQNK